MSFCSTAFYFGEAREGGRGRERGRGKRGERGERGERGMREEGREERGGEAGGGERRGREERGRERGERGRGRRGREEREGGERKGERREGERQEGERGEGGRRGEEAPHKWVPSFIISPSPFRTTRGGLSILHWHCTKTSVSCYPTLGTPSFVLQRCPHTLRITSLKPSPLCIPSTEAGVSWCKGLREGGGGGGMDGCGLVCPPELILVNKIVCMCVHVCV